MENKLIYTNHIKHYITDAEVSDYFKPSQVEMYNIRRRYQYFKMLLKLKDNERICEIGSGGGEALNILKVEDVTYFPVDLSQKNLKIILEKAATKTCPVAADVFSLPFRNATFDKLILSEVLEHLHNSFQAVLEIYLCPRNIPAGDPSN